MEFTYPPTTDGVQIHVLEFGNVADLNAEYENPTYISGNNEENTFNWFVTSELFVGGSWYALKYTIEAGAVV